MATFTSQNPCTGKIIHAYDALAATEIEHALQQASAAQTHWRQHSFNERAQQLVLIAAQLRKHQETLALSITTEMGKPLKESRAEIEKAAYCCDYYAEHAAAFLKPEAMVSDASRSYVAYHPLGVILGVLPWNFPVWLAARFFVPALMAGNTCVIKHDPHVMGTAQLLADVINEVTPFPIYINAPLAIPDIPSVINHPSIAAISFTGSTRAGAIIAGHAANAIKPCVLELGGSDPFIVLDDADIEKAASAASLSRMGNAGQSCIAAKRIIVLEACYDAMLQALKVQLEALSVGNPLLEGTDIGPLARSDLRDQLHAQVQQSIAAGATCLLGGHPIAGDGFFYPVTLLSHVTEKMRVFNEETFGPVACVIKATSIEHAITLANQTDYGLGASIWTANLALAETIACKIQAGQVAINGIVKTDPRLPSGGIKRSGYGRELGPHGIREFVNAKQIWVA